MFKHAFLLPCFMGVVFALSGGYAQAADKVEKATLSVPEALNILYVDDRKYSRSLFSWGEKKLELSPGSHKIVFEYDVLWELDSENHDRVISEPVMTIFSVQAGGKYKVNLPKINNASESAEFARKLEVTVIDNKTSAALEVEHRYQLQEKKFLADFVEDGDSFLTQSQADSKAGEMLRYWWNEASETQRKAFLEWVNQ